jgi:hypothetical protein
MIDLLLESISNFIVDMKKHVLNLIIEKDRVNYMNFLIVKSKKKRKIISIQLYLVNSSTQKIPKG